MNRIAIIMGSDSDWKIMKKAQETLLEFEEVPHCQVGAFAKWAEENGIQIIIAGAGGAAHLPGMMASYTTLPVIGVPINVTSLNGMDSLLSIVQMPKGIPVATVAIDNSVNAALLALRILSLSDARLKTLLLSFRNKIAAESRAKTDRLS